ncbi:MAG: type II/IV secretion system protein [Flavobacteriales bacterium]|nr:type II/IV secretion system protein [Flavobacteriales bacterium]
MAIAPSTDLLQLITPEQAWHYRVLPGTSADDLLTFFVDETVEVSNTAMELEMVLGKKVTFTPRPAEEIGKALAKFYRKTSRQTSKAPAKLDQAEAEDFLANLIHDAKHLGSSDIHVEPYEDRCRVRIRVDGQLVERYVISKSDYPGFVNKIKIKANLDIAEKRLPQDGRIGFKRGGEKFDIRVSILPTLHGEKIVMRLLNKDATDIDLEAIGFSETDLANYLRGVRKPHGIVLISGPTGSGKTTTLYATLKLLNKESRNIVTIEDPIEYTLEGINQVQLKEDIGLTFARALRTFLRQDPDIIMLGEIRDGETAAMAIRASLTGHLVLSTIHTNSAWGTVSRLVDMGIPPFLIAGTLNTTMAQRLVRLLCPDCKQQKDLSGNDLPDGFRSASHIAKQFEPVGCESCYYTGYKGRKAIFEVIPVDEMLQAAIREGAHDIEDHLKKYGVKTLAGNALELLESGQTSLEEIYPLLINHS